MRKHVFLDSAFRYAAMQTDDNTNKAAAEKMGIPYSTYAEYVRWRKTRKFPNDSNARKLADFIMWEFDDLLLAIAAAKQEKESVAEKIESLIPDTNLIFTTTITRSTEN